MYYQHPDYLGSVHLITNSAGATVQELGFDACSVKLAFCERRETKSIVELIPLSEAVREGRQRNATNWTYTSLPVPKFDRGYTGHEHLPGFELVNMNGRMYDPVVGRFLSPDPILQSPGNLQNYNHYSYVLNNPLKYTDPSGYQYYQMEEPWFSPGAENLFGGGGGSYRSGGSIYLSDSQYLGTTFGPDGSIQYGGPSDGAVDAWLANGLSSLMSLSDFDRYYSAGVPIRTITESRQLDYARKNGQRYLRGVRLTYNEATVTKGAANGGGDEGLLYPVSNDYRISSGHTENNRTIAELNQSRPHRAIDIASPLGTPIVSPYSGIVTTAQEFSYGQAIIIQHDYSFNGQSLSTSYSHLSQMSVNAGDPVTRGQIIGYTGTYGTGPHLHFVVRLDGQKVNPIIVFPLYHP